jgi:hypothetical protein
VIAIDADTSANEDDSAAISEPLVAEVNRSTAGKRCEDGRGEERAANSTLFMAGITGGGEELTLTVAQAVEEGLRG